jgi:hypothetical protein
VAVELARFVSNPGDGNATAAGCLLVWYYGRRVPPIGRARELALEWWDRHGADVRRRAALLPR